MAEEAEPGKHGRLPFRGDAVVGGHGYQMGGDQVVRAPADEHDDGEHPERPGAHGLREGEAGRGAGRRCAGAAPPGGASALPASRRRSVRRPVGRQPESRRVASNDAEREGEVERQGRGRRSTGWWSASRSR